MLTGHERCSVRLGQVELADSRHPLRPSALFKIATALTIKVSVSLDLMIQPSMCEKVADAHVREAQSAWIARVRLHQFKAGYVSNLKARLRLDSLSCLLLFIVI
jgi:hypothetical protein